jgi:hypothetical protein
LAASSVVKGTSISFKMFDVPKHGCRGRGRGGESWLTRRGYWRGNGRMSQRLAHRHCEPDTHKTKVLLCCSLDQRCCWTRAGCLGCEKLSQSYEKAGIPRRSRLYSRSCTRLPFRKHSLAPIIVHVTTTRNQSSKPASRYLLECCMYRNLL